MIGLAQVAEGAQRVAQADEVPPTFRAWRRRRGLTVAECCELLGAAERTLRSWEREEPARPSGSALRAIALAAGVPLAVVEARWFPPRRGRVAARGAEDARHPLDVLLDRRGLNHTTLAGEIQLSRQAVDAYVRAEYLPSPETLERLAVALDVDCAELEELLEAAFYARRSVGSVTR